MFKLAKYKVILVMASAGIAGLACPDWLPAVENGGSLQGVIKNSSGAPVSGAFVKAKNPDRRLTFMVISQARGRYTVPNVPPGKYVVQAIGDGRQSERSAPVEVASGGTANLDLSLTAPQPPAFPHAWPGEPEPTYSRDTAVPGQAHRVYTDKETSAAALRSLPEGEGKNIIRVKCTVCHGADFIAARGLTRERWQGVIALMREYIQNATLAKDLTDEEEKVLLDYLAKNFSNVFVRKAKPDPNSRLPRTLLQGEAAKYMVVEYELERAGAMPHDVTVDSKGNGWFSQSRGGRLGRLDGQTLAYSETSPPPAASKQVRLNGIMMGPGDKLWMIDSSPNNRRWLNYDTRSGEFNVFVAPKPKIGTIRANVMRLHPDGRVWTTSITSNQIVGLNPVTRQFFVYDIPAGLKNGVNATPYGMAISGDGKIWFAENLMDMMGRLDPATGNIDEFPIPVKNAVPRRMGTDRDGNIWVGLHFAGKLMKIDSKTTKMTVYTPPTEEAGVYSVDADLKDNVIWFSEQQADKIGRFDPKTETFVEFPLPNAETDNRRIEVDPSNRNRIWWSGFFSDRVGYIELLP